MPGDLPFLPSPVASGPWPTFSLDIATRESISLGKGPRAGGGTYVLPQGSPVSGPPNSNPGGVSGQGQPIRVAGPGGPINYHPAPVARAPVGEPGGVRPPQKPIRTAGPHMGGSHTGSPGAPPPAQSAPPPPQDATSAQLAPASGEDQRAREMREIAEDERWARATTAAAPPFARTLQFTAYHPNTVAVETWNTLLVYTYVTEALADIQADAGTFPELGNAPTVAKGQSSRVVARDVELTVEAHMEGVTFTPAKETFTLRENWKRSLFRFSGEATLAGREQRGWIDIYAGPMVPIARIDIAFSFRKGGTQQLATSPPRGMIVTSNIYDVAFISYCHRDREAFRQACEEYHRFGIAIYTDEQLEAGANYEVELARMIAEANIFHLLWSHGSARSIECQKEWLSALQREPTERFIKPWYWKQPLPPLPEEFSQHRISFKYEPLKRRLLRPATWF